MGKKRKKVWRSVPFCLLWTVQHGRNRVAFDNEAFSVYRLNRYFICNFWSSSNVYSGNRDRSLLDFHTWMGYRQFFWDGGVFFVLWLLFWLFPFSILLVYFWAALLYSFCG